MNNVIDASKNGSLKTCSAAFSVIYGMRNPLYDMIVEKKLTRSPLHDHSVFFIPVKYVAEIINQAEKRLSKGDAGIAGKSIRFGGYCTCLTIKKFHTIPEWDFELKHLPLVVLKIFFYVNYSIYGKNFGMTPVGADLCPTVCSFLEVVEEKVDNSTVETALEVGKVPCTHQTRCEKDGRKVLKEARRFKEEQAIFFISMVIGNFVYIFAGTQLYFLLPMKPCWFLILIK